MDSAQKYSTITDYESLYASGYFGHQANFSFFDSDFLPKEVIKFCRENETSLVVDVGSGNGLFGKMVRENGIDCIDVDIANFEHPHFIKCDFSSAEVTAISAIKSRFFDKIDGAPLITSFNLSEHIDPEHVADFLYNLSDLIQYQAIVSISTKPSSCANLYHSLILPIDTWKYMFSLLELHAEGFEPLQCNRSVQQCRNDSQDLIAVSMWEKRNIFRDHGSHQHYLKLTRTTSLRATRDDIRSRIAQVLDIGYRTNKRSLLSTTLPRLTYLINFIQDWSFLRSLMDVWPSDKIQVLLRSDLLVTAYAQIIESYLRRVGVPCRSISNINEAAETLAQWHTGPGELFVTATEGLRTVVHGLGSLVTLDARARGMTTVSLQHGDLIPEQTAHAAQFFGAMNAASAERFSSSATVPDATRPLVLGSLKRFDSGIVSADPDAIAFRLRTDAKHYRRRLLIGTNLQHWQEHKDGDPSLFDWLNHATARYPDILFLVRPHPDDWLTLESDLLSHRPNILIFDEITQLCVDWPLSRVIAAVDAIVSTHSTLVSDALAAGKPTGLIPIGIGSPRLQEEETAWRIAGVIELTPNDLEHGSIPSGLLHDVADQKDCSLYPTPYALSELLALVGEADDPAAFAAASATVRDSFLESCRGLCLDSHPHSNRQAVNVILRRFTCEH